MKRMRYEWTPVKIPFFGLRNFESTPKTDAGYKGKFSGFTLWCDWEGTWIVGCHGSQSEMETGQWSAGK